MSVIPFPYPEADPYLSHAGSATEPVSEFDPVAYLRQLRRTERAEYRRRVVWAFIGGLALGVVLFSVAVEWFA